MKNVIKVLAIVMLVLPLAGCNLLANEFGYLKSAFKGREAIIETFDEDSLIIDHIEGKSIDIRADGRFAIADSQGETVQKSGVLSLTIGGKPMVHVGSSLIMYEKGLTNVFDEFAKTVDIRNLDRSTPVINRIVNSYKNNTSGQKLVILIRSQTGKPLATFFGNEVSYFATNIDKSTGFIIDGKYLFVYRCDYTIYDMSLLQ